MSTQYDDDQIDFQITDEFELDDLSDQQGGVIEPCKAVLFTISEAKIRDQKSKDTGSVTVKRLVIDARISPLGIDGEGKYAGKAQFPEFVVWLDKTVHNSNWWLNESRYPTKKFLAALGFSADAKPKINDEFLIGLTGRTFVADIRKVEDRRKNPATGKYEPTGEYKNELTNFKSAE